MKILHKTENECELKILHKTENEWEKDEFTALINISLSNIFLKIALQERFHQIGQAVLGATGMKGLMVSSTTGIQDLAWECIKSG